MTDDTHLSLRVRCLSGTVSTDDIIPGRYKHMYSDPKHLAPHVFENLIPGFAGSLKTGDAIWSDSIFGIGSSREQAATSLLAAGVQVVLAPRFGRIFYRNAWNVGLGLIELAPPAGASLEGAGITVDWATGIVGGPFGEMRFAVPPPRLMEIRRSGGLLNWVIARHSGAHRNGHAGASHAQ